MAFKAKPIAVLTTDTTIYTCPVGTEAAAVLGIANVSGGAATYTLKFVSASLGQTITLASGVSVAANSSIKYPVPLALEGGDEIRLTASTGSAIVAFATVTQGTQGPQFKGLTMRGAYNAGVTYATNDVVTIGGSSYASRIDGNIGNAPASSPTQWAVLAEKGSAGTSFTWRGAYSGATAYAVQDVVTSGAGLWVALQATTGNAPPTLPTTSNAYWSLVVKNGDLTSADFATAAQIRAGTADKIVTADDLYLAAEAHDMTNITGTITVDFNNALALAKATQTGNVTLGATSNLKAGKTVVFEFKQDATGGRTLGHNNTYWVTSEGKALEIDTTANALNVLVGTVLSTGKVLLAVAGKKVA